MSLQFEFQVVGGVWQPYGLSLNRKLVALHTRGVQCASIRVRGFMHSFNLVSMVEGCVETGKTRPIRWTNKDATGKSVTSESNPAWTHLCGPLLPAKNFAPVQLPPWMHAGCAGMLRPVACTWELKTALEPKYRLVKVHEVSSQPESSIWPHRRQMFEAKLEELRQRHGYEVLPTQAWHGTSAGAVASILRTGFDVSAVSNGRVFGNGVYFASYTFIKQACAYSEPDDDGMLHVLLCDILPGRVEQGHVGMCGPSGPAFDNAVSFLRNPWMYIVWPQNCQTCIVVRAVVSFLKTN